VSCSNGTSASQQFLSFLLRWRQPQPRSHISKEERRPRARRPRLPQLAPPPRLIRHPRRTPRLHRTWRPHRTRHLPRHAPRRNRLARSSGLPGRPAVHPLRRWHDTRRRREPLRLRRSNGRKPPAATSAAAVERDSPNRPNPARATIRSAGRAAQRRWALRRRGLRALRQQHSPLTADATRPSNKMRPSPIS